MASLCQTGRYAQLTQLPFFFSISGVLTPYIGNGPFYSFEDMVIKFILQLESSNLDHKTQVMEFYI